MVGRRITRFAVWAISAAAAFSFFILYSPQPNSTEVTAQENFVPTDRFVSPPKEEDECDLFKGAWIWDQRGSSYTNTSCVTIPDSKNCAKHGREDTDYLHWRWKPDDCDLPRFEPTVFFEIVRGKKLAFIGDSVARNQMESLLCLLSQVETPTDVYKDEDDRFRTWYFPSHDFTILVLWTKFLVAGVERVVNGSYTGVFDIQLDQIDTQWTQNLHEYDYAVVSDGHWLFRQLYLYEKHSLVGCIFCNEANVTGLGLSFAFTKIFRTALKFITDCEKCGRLVTLVRTFSPAHFEHGTWNDGGNCNRTRPYSERELTLGGTEWDISRAQMAEVARAREEGKNKEMRFGTMDVTKAMLMRPDGHPNSHWNNKGMEGYNDCVHWCLPGPIDAWNDLLLGMVKKEKSLKDDSF
ncbi:xyloglucan O-acetyltransferase 3 [Aristolochia californica]|uniref:xyloglucan O-acetyltransferase 3 n=1 Tax=Aristolochia californica TaxID=171875 RepID=UPI0035E129D4